MGLDSESVQSPAPQAKSGGSSGGGTGGGGGGGGGYGVGDGGGDDMVLSAAARCSEGGDHITHSQSNRFYPDISLVFGRFLNLKQVLFSGERRKRARGYWYRTQLGRSLSSECLRVRVRACISDSYLSRPLSAGISYSRRNEKGKVSEPCLRMGCSLVEEVIHQE